MNLIPSSEFQALLTPIWEYLAVDEVPTRADAIFVFGGVDLHVPQHAANLYLDGYAPHVLVTGSAGRYTTEMFAKHESEVFSYYMTRLGVPPHQITVERSARNTGENVQLGIAALRSEGILPNSLLLVAKPFSLRRCVATFRLHFPDLVLIPSRPPGPMMLFVDRPREAFVDRLLSELERLRSYPDKGFIVRQEIPPDVAPLETRLRAALRANPKE